MIGFLCTDGTEEKFSKKFHELFQSKIKGCDKPIIVFTISNVHLPDNTVTGSMVSIDGIKTVTGPLPSIIFNLSTQRSKSGSKMLRGISDIRDIKIVNDVNRLDQNMIMEMLLSWERTAKYVLPRDTDAEGPDTITIPPKGLSLDRDEVLQAEPEGGEAEIPGERPRRTWKKASSKIKMNGIVLKMPQVMTFGKKPVVIRVYVQRGLKGKWIILGKRACSNDIFKAEKMIKNLNSAAMSIICYIGKFIPSLGSCTMDFIMGEDETPYLLSFGGFDQNLFFQTQNDNIVKNFYRNMVHLAQHIGTPADKK